jgi:hypothetical protein
MLQCGPVLACRTSLSCCTDRQKQNTSLDSLSRKVTSVSEAKLPRSHQQLVTVCLRHVLPIVAALQLSLQLARAVDGLKCADSPIACRDPNFRPLCLVSVNEAVPVV